MTAENIQTNTQQFLFRVGLSLDSFLLNGIPYGVIHRDLFNGFAQKTAATLLENLDSLDSHAIQAAAFDSNVMRAVATLKSKVHQLIDVVNQLGSFRRLPLEEVNALVGQVSALRRECGDLIESLESYFACPEPFYLSRSLHSGQTMNQFLAGLPRLFSEEWRNSTPTKELPAISKSN